MTRIDADDEEVLFFTFGTLSIGAALLLVIGMTRIAATDWSALPWLVWVGLGYLVVFASFASISLLQYASMRLKAAKVMAYTYLTPSFVILWEVMLAGDLPPGTVLPGIGLTVIALLILLREGRLSPVARASGT